MQAAAKQFEQTLTDINTRLNALHGQLDAIVWTGQSRTTFDGTMTEWGRQFTVLYQHLAAMAQLLGAGANDYQHASEDAVVAGNFFK